MLRLDIMASMTCLHTLLYSEMEHLTNSSMSVPLVCVSMSANRLYCGAMYEMFTSGLEVRVVSTPLKRYRGSIGLDRFVSARDRSDLVDGRRRAIEHVSKSQPFLQLPTMTN